MGCPYPVWGLTPIRVWGMSIHVIGHTLSSYAWSTKLCIYVWAIHTYRKMRNDSVKSTDATLTHKVNSYRLFEDKAVVIDLEPLKQVDGR